MTGQIRKRPSCNRACVRLRPLGRLRMCLCRHAESDAFFNSANYPAERAPLKHFHCATPVTYKDITIHLTHSQSQVKSKVIQSKAREEEEGKEGATQMDAKHI